MTVIQKYIEFLKEYNKLLERGSKNVLRLKNTLWLDDFNESSIIVQNNFDNLLAIEDEKEPSSKLLEVKRPAPKDEDINEESETSKEKFDRETYSFLYQAARDTSKNSSLEFVYSFGLFHLKLGDTMVKVHLFHIPLTAAINGGNIIFRLHITEDPYIDSFFLNHPQIDRDLLLSYISKFEKGIEDSGINYLKTDAFKNLLSNDSLGLHPSLVYDRQLSKPADTLTTNFVQLSPCLILRNKRPRHFQKLMEKIINFSAENNVNPSVLDILLSQRNNLAQDQSHYFSTIYESIKDKFTSLELSDFEQFFPLPYNREQLEIYKNHQTHELSVVTGPPGTGKSHSIVNLLCAMLAEGKRILITAKTDKALESLLDKIPPQFNGLVMADIKQQNHSDYTLSNSIGNIRELLLDKNAYNLDTDLSRLDKQKDRYNSEKAKLATLLSQEYNKIGIPHFGRSFSIYELYVFVEERKANWGFLKDQINDETLNKSDQIIKALESYIKLLPKDKKLSTLDFNESFALLDLVDFKTFNGLKSELKNKAEILKVQDLKHFKIDSAIELSESFATSKNKDLICNDEGLLESLLSKQSFVAREIQDYQINRSAIEIKEDRAKYLRDISTYLALIPEGKDKLPFLQKKFNSIYKDLKYIDQISVNDVFCNNRKTLNDFRDFLSVFSKLNELIELLSKHKFVEYTLNEQCSLKEMQRVAKKGLVKVEVNLEILNKINRHSVKEFVVKHNIQNTDCEGILSKAKELIKVYEDALVLKEKKEEAGSAIQKTKDEILKIGIKSFICDEDLALAKDKLLVLNKAHSAYQKFEISKNLLKEYLPSTLDNLSLNPSEVLSNIHKDSLYLKYGAQEVEKATNIDIQKTGERLRHATEAIKNCKADILSGLARSNFKNRFDENEKEKFINMLSTFDYSFKQSKKGIADKDKFRRNAQKTAKEIAPNISCWVMKFDDVLKTVDATPEVFDCIITDEASQLNFNSLLLGYYGKKMIVVGDEKQTSPEDISITNEAFDSLRKNNLAFMGDEAINIRADASLFSLANMVAGTTNQMLREHFRCVPELIDFSKKYFYENKLVPLKVISADRLNPKQRIFIQNSYLKDKIVKKEISAISRKLHEMLEDPKYRNKTIGVVSLGLAKHTEALKSIVEDFPIKKLEKHNIIIDSAAEFQGDERDVILVSLGTANTVNNDNSFKAPTSIVDNIENNLTSKLRGINVGLSRAKEQMILFHSIELEQLKTNDFRRKIISFFDEKFSPVKPIQLPPNLEKRYRIPENRPKPFDSWFEYDVASSLFDRGYHFIVPQYEVKKKELFSNPKLGKETYVHFKLDLVVYNNGTPVAIECDGDDFHSSVEDVAYDIERQEFLERIGWKIHRVTYSSFKINAEKEIDKLVDFIERNSLRNIEEFEDKYEENEQEEEYEEDVEVQEDSEDLITHAHKIKKEKDQNRQVNKQSRTINSQKTKDLFEAQNIVPDLFSQDFSTPPPQFPTVKVNSKCRIIMIDMQNKVEEVLLMDIARNLQPKSRDGIQIVSIYSDLGKLLLGKKEGVTVKFPERNQRVKIEKVFK